MEQKQTKKAAQDKNNNYYVYPRLNYDIKDPAQRTKLVYEIIDKIPKQKLTPYYLEQLTNYLVENTENKKARIILTNNRLFTINRRETSYEGLIAKMENGEDGIYNLTSEKNKNIFLVPKIRITDYDVKTIPGLKELQEGIKLIKEMQQRASGRKKYLLTKQLIQMRQQQYILKSEYYPPVSMTKVTKSPNTIDLTQHITIDKNGEPVSDCLVSFFNPNHISCLLCNYSKLKEQCWGHFDSDWWYFMLDFDKLAEKALKEKYPIFYDIVVYKIDGLQNKEISSLLQEKHGIKYTPEYLSTLWRKKIPKIIADKAKEDWIIWHYTEEERGQWKRCSRCHEIKLAHPYFFSRNNTSKDGWYSICKCCRNKKK